MNKRITRTLLGLGVGLYILLNHCGFSGAPDVQAQADPTPTPTFSESGEPEPVNARVCDGQDALIFQSPDETGAGVTMSIFDPWGCMENQEMLVIGPWGGPVAANAHSACLAHGRQDLVTLASATGWENGSVWALSPENIVFGHPLVVECAEVTSLEEMGLNPHDSHLVPQYYEWVFLRAGQLLTPEQRVNYCIQHGEEGLSRNILCANWFMEFQNKVRLFSEP